MFSQSNVLITGGQFTTIQNRGVDATATILWTHVAQGAIFDSAERYSAGKCHPGTRQKVIERIIHWIDDPQPTEHVLWLHGPAGAGKSAIAQTICEALKESHPEKYGGSFFFQSGNTDRGNASKLFATLSYQLALHFPSVREEMNRILSCDPSLPTKSMDIQLSSLIVQPLLRCQPFLPHSPTVIIDGLDECADDEGLDIQRKIIDLIAQSIVKQKIPLRFMIASRPEFWIRNAFETSPLLKMSLSLSLRDDQNADKDIRTYLADKFEGIRVENKHILGSVELPWPPQDVIDQFVYDASGQYVYASTVIKFVGKSSRFSDPREQLRILTSPGPHRAFAFSELDRLYETILSAYPRPATMQRVLGGILANSFSALIIEIFLGVDRTEVTLALNALSSLIEIHPPHSLPKHELLLQPIFGSFLGGREDNTVSHRSFCEFLADKIRSGRFHVDAQCIISQITRTFFALIHRNLDDNYSTEPHISLNIGLAAYQCIMKTTSSFILVHSDSDTLIAEIKRFAERLSLEHDIELVHIGCFLQDINWAINISSRLSSRRKDADKLGPAVLGLQNAILYSRKRCLQQLESSQKFWVTFPLACLSDDLSWHSVDGIITGTHGHTVTDVVSTFQQYRHFVYMTYNRKGRSWYAHMVNLDEDPPDDRHWHPEGWRTRGEWKAQRIAITSQYLQIPLGSHYTNTDRYLYLGNFFRSQNLSDIRSASYFQNHHNLSILRFMMDLSRWTPLLPDMKRNWLTRDRLLYFTTQILCWFNRQLSNPKTLDVLEDQDNNLPDRMRVTMKEIFQQFLLPNYKRPYHSELYVSYRYPNSRSVRLTAHPLTQGSIEEKNVPYIFTEALDPSWRTFHDEVFGKQLPTGLESTIDHRDWHPHLLSCLLEILATDWYKGFARREGEEPPGQLEEGLLVYIVKCLPYAETSQHNLDCLRVIMYLFTRATLEWQLPVDFWTLSAEFLRKYDASMLSSQELQLFEERINAMVAKYQCHDDDGVSQGRAITVEWNRKGTGTRISTFVSSKREKVMRFMGSFGNTFGN